MTRFATLAELRELCRDLPSGDDAAAAAVAARQEQLTKPPGSLGRLESLVGWLAQWQGRASPRLDMVRVIVFAGSHGVTAQGVSAYPAEVTTQMVANFTAGGAAINQLARSVGAELRVVPIEIDRPTQDFTQASAMTDDELLEAVSIGYDVAEEGPDLLCLGEMGIGNTTAAAALCCGLFGGDPHLWVGRGTGVDDAGLERKASAVRAGCGLHGDRLGDPLAAAAALGGRELAAILGATLAARHRGIPVLLDGFVCTAAAAPLARLHDDGLAHVQAGHVSSEHGHRALLEEIGLSPILDLGMRLGEASGACLAVNLLRSALACHVGMATFESAGVSKNANES